MKWNEFPRGTSPSKEGRKEHKHSLAFGRVQAEEVVSTEMGKKKSAKTLMNS